MNFKKRNVIKWNIVYIIIYLVFLISFPYLRSLFSNSFVLVNKPSTVLGAAHKSTNFFAKSFSNFGDYFSSRKYLITENERLQNELELERNKNIVNRNVSLFGENKVVVAKKIFSDFTNIYGTILLNKGVEDGVHEDDTVFVYENNAIGKITSVNPNNSLVTLFSKDKNKVEGVIKAKKNNNTLFELDLPTLENKKEDEIDMDNKDINTENLENLDNENSSSSTSFLNENSTIVSEVKDSETSPSSIIIDIYGYGGGDFISQIPANIEVSTGTVVYLGTDETKSLGEVVSVEKQDASFYQILLIRGHYNTRANDDYYIKRN